MYFDSCVFDADSLEYLSKKANPGRVMLGSNQPFPIGVFLVRSDCCPRANPRKSMKLIEPDEMEDFHKVLARFKLSAEDFDLAETDTTDPQSDEIFGLTGFVTVTRKSTGKQNEYPIGDGSTWVAQFQRDVQGKIFD